jgi:hypothetical protein
MLEDDDMRAVFFDLDDFAREVIIKPNGKDPYTIRAIYDAHPVMGGRLAEAQVGFSGGMKNTGASPQIRCRTSDVADIKGGRAIVEVDGVEFSTFGIPSRTAPASPSSS